MKLSLEKQYNILLKIKNDVLLLAQLCPFTLVLSDNGRFASLTVKCIEHGYVGHANFFLTDEFYVEMNHKAAKHGVSLFTNNTRTTFWIDKEIK